MQYAVVLFYFTNNYAFRQCWNLITQECHVINLTQIRGISSLNFGIKALTQTGKYCYFLKTPQGNICKKVFYRVVHE